MEVMKQWLDNFHVERIRGTTTLVTASVTARYEGT
jgi:hypothetical protein